MLKLQVVYESIHLSTVKKWTFSNHNIGKYSGNHLIDIVYHLPVLLVRCTLHLYVAEQYRPSSRQAQFRGIGSSNNFIFAS